MLQHVCDKCGEVLGPQDPWKSSIEDGTFSLNLVISVISTGLEAELCTKCRPKVLDDLYKSFGLLKQAGKES